MLCRHFVINSITINTYKTQLFEPQVFALYIRWILMHLIQASQINNAYNHELPTGTNPVIFGYLMVQVVDSMEWVSFT